MEVITKTVEDKVDSCVQDWTNAVERFGRKAAEDEGSFINQHKTFFLETN